MRIELDMFRTSHFTIDKRYYHVFCVLIRVSRIHCTFMVSGLSKDTKNLNPRSRLSVFERDLHIQ